MSGGQAAVLSSAGAAGIIARKHTRMIPQRVNVKAMRWLAAARFVLLGILTLFALTLFAADDALRVPV